MSCFFCSCLLLCLSLGLKGRGSVLMFLCWKTLTCATILSCYTSSLARRGKLDQTVLCKQASLATRRSTGSKSVRMILPCSEKSMQLHCSMWWCAGAHFHLCVAASSDLQSRLFYAANFHSTWNLVRRMCSNVVLGTCYHFRFKSSENMNILHKDDNKLRSTISTNTKQYASNNTCQRLSYHYRAPTC